MMKNIINTSTAFLKKHYLKIIVLLIIAGISFYFYQHNQQPEQQQVFEHPQYRDITKTLEVAGKIDAKRKARLRFIAGGKITYLGAQEGDWVEKWQTIATIDQRDLQKRLEKNLNLYMKERWDFETNKEEFEEDLPTLENRREQDKNQWDLENSVIDVELQDIAISNTVMSAPFAGVLVETPVSVPQTQVLHTDYWELIDPESLIFKAEVDEQDTALLKVGQPVIISLDAYDDQNFVSQINYIHYKSMETSTGTVFIAEMPLPVDAEGLNKYRLGMNGDALIELAKKENVLTIPLNAIKFRNDQVFVDIKTSDGEIKEKEIQVGLETNEYIEVLEGLSEQDLILIPQAE